MGEKKECPNFGTDQCTGKCSEISKTVNIEILGITQGPSCDILTLDGGDIMDKMSISTGRKSQGNKISQSNSLNGQERKSRDRLGTL